MPHRARISMTEFHIVQRGNRRVCFFMTAMRVT
jgi:hypothetical protein